MKRAVRLGKLGILGYSLGLAAFVSLSFINSPAEAGLREGVEAYKKGDFATAHKEWLPLAEQGNPNALYNVAQLYRTGRGVPKDVNIAEKFYREAAERGHVAAQGNLGTLYYFAFPDSPRVKPAIEWWEKGATNGDGRSQYMLGVVYFNGSQVPRDTIRAYAWMRLANESGVPEAIKAEQQMVQALSVDEISQGYALAQKLAPGTKLKPAPSAGGAGISAAGAQAKPKIEEKPIERVAAPPTPKPAPAQRQVASTPTPKVVAKPAARPSSSPAASNITGGRGSFFVQVSASGSEPAARSLRDKLQSAGGLNGGSARLSPTVNDSGATIYRVQVGPYATRADATAQCNLMKAKKQNCFVVSN